MVRYVLPFVLTQQQIVRCVVHCAFRKLTDEWEISWAQNIISNIQKSKQQQQHLLLTLSLRLLIGPQKKLILTKRFVTIYQDDSWSETKRHFSHVSLHKLAPTNKHAQTHTKRLPWLVVPVNFSWLSLLPRGGGSRFRGGNVVSGGVPGSIVSHRATKFSCTKLTKRMLTVLRNWN